MTVDPELVKAIGIAVAGILTVWQARTASKVRDLETRLKAVEKERDDVRHLFRVAVKHLREWLAWSRQHAPGVPPPPMPPELASEV